ncbi:MAG: hypothetical protein ACFBSC_02535 [Microcoleaceae cyanobacterium]
MPLTPDSIPDNLSFQQAIQVVQTLLQQAEAGELRDTEIESLITRLVATENGARGLFVTDLTADYSLADQTSPGLVEALKTSPEIVSELLVKNVAMSTAMEIHHQRNQDVETAKGSHRVQQRSIKLIQTLDLPIVKEKVEKLRQSAQTGAGPYQTFLNRWNYDEEQRKAIAQALAF